MIETAAPYESLYEILATLGLAGVYVGPNNLELCLGFGRSTRANEPKIGAALERISSACAQANLIAGLHCSSPEMARHWAE